MYSVFSCYPHKKNVEKDGTVPTVGSNVQGIVETVLRVTT